MAPARKRFSTSYSRTVKRPRTGMLPAPLTTTGALEIKNFDTIIKWKAKNATLESAPINTLAPILDGGETNAYYVCKGNPDNEYFNSLVNITRGNGSDQRIGQYIIVKTIEVRLTFISKSILATTGFQQTIARVIIYVDKQFNGATDHSFDPGNFQSLLGNTAGNLDACRIYDQKNSQRYIILDDFTTELSQNSTPGANNVHYTKHESRKINCNIPINYDKSLPEDTGVGGTGYSDQIMTNNISMMVLFEGGSTVECTGNARVRFIG